MITLQDQIVDFLTQYRKKLGSMIQASNSDEEALPIGWVIVNYEVGRNGVRIPTSANLRKWSCCNVA
jgi:hypothetical protein